ncbi:hypothetical protein [Microbacterium paraoxydans]|uniref:hypothetical protein n=1 Tax=Microbacterium paraoxydans TaxID=199592 RepID=UPI0013B45E06|nr:hypothetical protein [Microbacterium paraoxydans]
MVYPLGRVRGRFLQAVQGIPGDGSEPVYTPVRGLRVRFRALLDDVTLRTLQNTDPVSLLLQQFECQTDQDGYLVNGAGERWQELPATVDPELGFSAFLWEAAITSPIGNPAPFRFVLPAYTGPEDARDITTVAHVSTNPGRELAEWESVYLRAQGVVAQVVAAGDAQVAEIEAAGDGVEQRAVAAATAAAASYATQAQGHASTASAAATAASNSASNATAQAVRAEAAADSIDTAQLEAMIAAKADLQNGKVPLTQLPAATTATADTMVQRGAGGVITIGAPTADAHAATKQYVDGRTADTGWQAITVASGVQAQSGHTAQVRVLNGFIAARFRLERASGSFASGGVVGTLPAGMRPPRTSDAVFTTNAVTADAAALVRGEIAANGDISIYFGTGRTVPTWIGFNGLIGPAT